MTRAGVLSAGAAKQAEVDGRIAVLRGLDGGGQAAPALPARDVVQRRARPGQGRDRLREGLVIRDAESLREFAERYTAAWCSLHPERVAAHYAPNGSLTTASLLSAVPRSRKLPGKNVRISGCEVWTIGDDGLIAASLGHFAEAEYERQLEHGA